MAESPNLKIATSAEHQGMEGENNWKQSWEEKWITATRKRGAGPKKFQTKNQSTGRGGAEEGQRLDQNRSTATNPADRSLQNTWVMDRFSLDKWMKEDSVVKARPLPQS
jgi:hypothetical protein